MKYLIPFAFFGLIFSSLFPVVGQSQTVSLANETVPVLGGGEDCNNSAVTNCKNLVTEVKDGSSDSPHLVYVPFYNEASSGPAGGNHPYSLLYDGGDATEDLPSYDSEASADANGHIVTKLTINAGSSGAPQILYAGILDSEGTNFNIYDNNLSLIHI